MKQASYGSTDALEALLETGVFYKADCYTLTLLGGGVIRLTNADVDIAYGGNRFSSDGLRIDPEGTRSTGHWKTGLDTDQWNVTVLPRARDDVTGELFPDKIGDVPWIEAASAGVLDGADVLIERAYFASAPTWPLPAGGAATPVACIVMFAGLMGDVDHTDTAVALTINDYRVLLTNTQIPRFNYSAQCRHTLFNAACGLSREAFAINGVAGAGSTRAELMAALGAPGGSRTFTRGRVVMTSGRNATFARTIRSWGGPGGSFLLLNPFPFAIAAGDTFTAYPGCDKTRASCDLFGNSINYGGQRFIPAPEAAL